MDWRRDLGRTAPHGDGVEVLGPAPAPLSILRGRHRRRLLLKTRRDVAVQPILREWLGKVLVARGARVEVGCGPGIISLTQEVCRRSSPSLDPVLTRLRGLGQFLMPRPLLINGLAWIGVIGAKPRARCCVRQAVRGSG